MNPTRGRAANATLHWGTEHAPKSMRRDPKFDSNADTKPTTTKKKKNLISTNSMQISVPENKKHKPEVHD
jgi:hypothetical protein